MKKVFLKILLTVLFLSNGNFAQTFNAKINSVTLYLGGAIIEQTAKVHLKKGANTIRITNLAAGIDARTLIANAEKGNIVSVENVRNFILHPPETAEIKGLKDSIDLLTARKLKLDNLLKVNNSRIELLKTLIEKGTKNFSINTYKKILPFYSDELLKYLKDLAKIKNREKEITRRINKIKKQLAELNSKNNRVVNEVRLIINANRQTESLINLGYFTKQADWAPRYKVFADSLNAPIEIKLNAQIKQNTGINWVNVPIKFSTRKPYLNNNRPHLKPIFVDFYKHGRYFYRKDLASFSAKKISSNNAQTIETIQKELMVEFFPNKKFNVPSDNKKHLVFLKSFSLKGEYRYFAIPSKSKDAFLICDVSGWEKLNLVPAQASIYFEKSYVGNSFINTITSAKKLELSLGRDLKVHIERKKIKDFTEVNFLGTTLMRTLQFKIELKNNKSKNLHILVEDQIPISKNEKIEVELLSQGYSSFNKKTGIIKWEINLPPFSQKLIDLKYSIKFPSGKTIEFPVDKTNNNFF